MSYRTLDGLSVAGKRVLLRADLNVPVRDGKITDLTRLERLAPTLRELSGKGGRVIVLSHFERPKGERVPSMSLAPVAAALGEVLHRPVRFAEDCIGQSAREAIAALADGDVLVLENTRFYPGEERNDSAFAQQLAALGDLYVNDAFSVSHRAHASTEGIAHLLPSYAGRLMQAELEALRLTLTAPERPLGAVVGGVKISTKLELLGNLVSRVDVLAIGGAMANTFLAAEGKYVGRSVQEMELHASARGILRKAEAAHCTVLLPIDAVTAPDLNGTSARIVAIDAVPPDSMILDVGPRTVAALKAHLATLKTLVWNGPLGAFETPPFDTGTTDFARAVAAATQAGTLHSVAGGGDTVSALRHAGAYEQFTYVSAAGGAFLEWLEGRKLPGVVALGG